MRLVAFLIALPGLVIALSPSLSEFDWRGITLASLAAAIVLGERLTMLQFTGGIMVVTALILSTRESAKHG